MCGSHSSFRRLRSSATVTPRSLANFGSFFPVSTHATLLFAGGSNTGIPQGLKITEPYDGLSYAPTVLKLAGKKEFSELPGPVIDELFPAVEAER